ncbi:hypothetical protein ACHAXT_011205 [Thalassiosira profunda]
MGRFLAFLAVWACVWGAAARWHPLAAVAASRLPSSDAREAISVSHHDGAPDAARVTRQIDCNCGPSIASAALQRALNIRGGSSPQSASASTSTAANKKYASAATSAMQTISSLRSKSRAPTLPDLLSESALMDRETNAIYWQGGAKILSTSFTVPYLTRRGVVHVKASILSAALWLWIWGRASRHLAARYFGPGGNAEGAGVAFSLPFISGANAPPFLRKLASLLAPVVQFVLLLFHSLLYLRLPPYSTKVIVATIILYLLESYTCSTRRYLSHALNAPAEVEAYLERIRTVEPSVTWKVRCFHYENRDLWRGFGKLVDGWMGKEGGDEGKVGSANSNTASETPSPLLARKVVTHEAVGNYTFGSWEDHTLASVWKRSHSFSNTAQEAPFSKLSLSKLLVLKNQAAREDYFAQQAAFVMQEGRKDVHAEFATSISVEGFRPKVLAVRPVKFRASNISAALFRQHIYVFFTLLGLSLPYRIWFAKHCDEIRVTVVKETSSLERPKPVEEVAEKKKSTWFWKRSQETKVSDGGAEAQNLFRKSMQSYSLYEGDRSTTDKQPDSENKDTPADETSAELADESVDETCGEVDEEETTADDDNKALEPVVNGDATESEAADAAKDGDAVQPNPQPPS